MPQTINEQFDSKAALAAFRQSENYVDGYATGEAKSRNQLAPSMSSATDPGPAWYCIRATYTGEPAVYFNVCAADEATAISAFGSDFLSVTYQDGDPRRLPENWTIASTTLLAHLQAARQDTLDADPGADVTSYDTAIANEQSRVSGEPPPPPPEETPGDQLPEGAFFPPYISIDDNGTTIIQAADYFSANQILNPVEGGVITLDSGTLYPTVDEGLTSNQWVDALAQNYIGITAPLYQLDSEFIVVFDPASNPYSLQPAGDFGFSFDASDVILIDGAGQVATDEFGDPWLFRPYNGLTSSGVPISASPFGPFRYINSGTGVEDGSDLWRWTPQDGTEPVITDAIYVAPSGPTLISVTENADVFSLGYPETGLLWVDAETNDPIIDPDATVGPEFWVFEQINAETGELNRYKDPTNLEDQSAQWYGFFEVETNDFVRFVYVANENGFTITNPGP